MGQGSRPISGGMEHAEPKVLKGVLADDWRGKLFYSMPRGFSNPNGGSTANQVANPTANQVANQVANPNTYLGANPYSGIQNGATYRQFRARQHQHLPTVSPNGQNAHISQHQHVVARKITVGQNVTPPSPHPWSRLKIHGLRCGEARQGYFHQEQKWSCPPECCLHPPW